MTRSAESVEPFDLLVDVYERPPVFGAYTVDRLWPDLLDGFFSANEYFGFLNTFRYEEERVSLDKYTIIERGGIRRFDNWLQYYGVDELTAELADNGFVVRDVYANVAGDAYQEGSPTIAVAAQAS
jgi:hypothetical protein